MAVSWRAAALTDVARIARHVAVGARELAPVRPYTPVCDVGNDDAVTILRVWHAARDRWAAGTERRFRPSRLGL